MQYFLCFNPTIEVNCQPSSYIYFVIAIYFNMYNYKYAKKKQTKLIIDQIAFLVCTLLDLSKHPWK